MHVVLRSMRKLIALVNLSSQVNQSEPYSTSLCHTLLPIIRAAQTNRIFGPLTTYRYSAAFGPVYLLHVGHGGGFALLAARLRSSAA